jgi:plastocyanin
MRTLLVGTLLLTFLACSGSPSDPGGNPPGGNPPGGNPPGGNPPGGSGNTITVGASSFTPSSLQVTAGQSVTWEATGGGHTITPSGHTLWSRVEVGTGGTALEVTFSTPGTYRYYCELHGSPGVGMAGQVVVVQAGS